MTGIVRMEMVIVIMVMMAFTVVLETSDIVVKDAIFHSHFRDG